MPNLILQKIKTNKPFLLFQRALLSGGLFFILSGSAVLSAEVVYDAHTEVELVSDNQSVAPGKPFWVALRMKMDPHWHVYWRNPGDSGLSPAISWRLPEGIEAGEIQWPYPKRIEIEPLTSYGYEDEVFLLVQIFPQENLSVGSDLNFTADVTWLACEIECVPGKASLNLILPVSTENSEIHTRWAEAFEQTRKKLPQTITGWNIAAEQTDGEILLTFISPDENLTLDAVELYPYRDDIIDHAALQSIKKIEQGYRLRILKSTLLNEKLKSLEGIVVSENGWGAQDGHKALEIELDFNHPSVAITSMMEASSGFNLWLTIAFAFLGGLILNAMPCVLPVLSIKILGLVEQIHSRQKSPVVSSVFYTLGILASFWVLLLVLLLLKSAGQSIGWGFQFKSPHFLIFITTLLFVMGLNLLGIFEIGTGLTTFGSKFKKGEGWGESFFNGVLATIVATPCMAPFMGTAVGTALTQTTLIAFIIFTFLGLGLAFPYLIISIFPGLHRLVPKPGLWMEHLKKLLAFPLFLTVLWLAWVLGRQYGVGAMAMLLYGQALIALALWIWGTWNVPASKANIQMAARIWAGIFLVIGLFLTYQSIAGEKERNMPRQAGLWQPFSPGLLEQLLREERAVFVNFTADWCLTCQANKELVIHRPGVLEAFQQNGVALLEADWTNFDPDITEELARYGRSGVPLYVFYPSGQKEPVILPEIITAQILLDILEQQDKSITINSEEE